METSELLTIALIPAYREERFIRDVVVRSRAILPRVVVVDDGSADRTAAEAQAAGAVVLRHETNQGKGAAIKTGLRYALEQGVEQVILLDGDGQHLPEEISRFLEAALKGGKLILGNRMGDTAAMPLVRSVVNRTMSGIISHACGQAIPDTQCGFRLVHRELIPRILTGTNAFDYETEMLLIASALHCRIASVPISTIYGDEKSKIHPVRDTLAFVCLMCRHWAGRRTEE